MIIKNGSAGQQRNVERNNLAQSLVEPSIMSDNPAISNQEPVLVIVPSPGGSASKQRNVERNNSARPLVEPSIMSYNPTNPNQEPVLIIATPPDGGWGWMITFCSFSICMIVDGIGFNFGQIFGSIEETFSASKSLTALVGAVQTGAYLTLGPMNSSLINMFDCRKVAIFGSLLAAGSILLSSFCVNIDQMIVTFGLMTGAGFGMMYLPAIVMVGYYFEKRRALATGIACCGSGMGAFIFSPLVQYLLKTLKLHDSLRILSAITFSGAFFACFYRPLTVSVPPNMEFTTVMPTIEEEEEDSELKLEAPKSLRTLRSVEVTAMPARMSIGTVSTLGRGLEESQEKFVIKPMSRPDVFYGGSMYSMRERLDDEGLGLVKHSRQKIDVDVDALPGCERLYQAAKSIFDVSLLSSPTFIVFCIQCFLSTMGYFVPFAYIPAFAQSLGVEMTKSAFLVSILGLTNTIGRVIVGFVADMSWVDCLLSSNLAQIVAGIITCLVFIYNSYELLMVYMAFFGVMSAVYVPLKSVILVELMGLPKLTNAFGLVIMFMGIASFIGSPIAGSLVDTTGNYTSTFLLAGITIAAGGILGLPLRRIAACERNRKATRRYKTKQEAELAMKELNSFKI